VIRAGSCCGRSQPQSKSVYWTGDNSDWTELGLSSPVDRLNRRVGDSPALYCRPRYGRLLCVVSLAVVIRRSRNFAPFVRQQAKGKRKTCPKGGISTVALGRNSISTMPRRKYTTRMVLWQKFLSLGKLRGVSSCWTRHARQGGCRSWFPGRGAWFCSSIAGIGDRFASASWRIIANTIR
jgi:hypothetical protein